MFKDEIAALTVRAAAAHDPDDAVKLSQAALNIAHAMNSVYYTEYRAKEDCDNG